LLSPNGSYGITVQDSPHAILFFEYQVETKLFLPTLNDLETLIGKIEVAVSNMLAHALFNECQSTLTGSSRRFMQQVRTDSHHQANHRILSLQGISPLPNDMIQDGGTAL